MIKPLPALTWATAVADFFLPKVYRKNNEVIVSKLLVKYVFPMTLELGKPLTKNIGDARKVGI